MNSIVTQTDVKPNMIRFLLKGAEAPLGKKTVAGPGTCSTVSPTRIPLLNQRSKSLHFYREIASICKTLPQVEKNSYDKTSVKYYF